MRTVTIGNFKGGCGKTTLAHHLAALADERGMRVAVVDTDRQGDLYRRLTSATARADERPRSRYGRAGAVMYAPGDPPPADALASADLVIVDTPPAARPKAAMDVVAIPVDGVDAALNCNESVADALEVGARLVIVVKNGVDEGGRAFAREFKTLGDNLPDRVVLCPVAIPRGQSIKRSSLTNRPAWTDPYKAGDAKAIRQACEWLLQQVSA